MSCFFFVLFFFLLTCCFETENLSRLSQRTKLFCFFVFFSGHCLTEAEREQQLQKKTGRKPSFCCDQNLKGSRDILHKLLHAGRETQTSAWTRESDRRISATLANQRWLSIPDTNHVVMAGIMQIKPSSLNSLKLFQENASWSHPTIQRLEVCCCKPRICCDDTELMVLFGFNHDSGWGQGEVVFWL